MTNSSTWLRRAGFGRPGVAALFAAATLAACADRAHDGSAVADDPSGSSEAAVKAFEGSVGSLNALGRIVLEGLTFADTLSLEAVRLTEYEHNEVVWPELPASAPEINHPVDLAWGNIDRRNLVGRSRLIDAFRDRELEFRSAECRGETRAFDTFVVHTDCYVLFTEVGGVEGRILQVQAFEDVLERGGGMKVFRYYDEDVSPAPGSA